MQHPMLVLDLPDNLQEIAGQDGLTRGKAIAADVPEQGRHSTKFLLRDLVLRNKSLQLDSIVTAGFRILAQL